MLKFKINEKLFNNMEDKKTIKENKNEKKVEKKVDKKDKQNELVK